MKKKSAGILLYRRTAINKLEVLLVHPGGPYFKNKHLGAWTIPKGEIEDGEDPLDTAIREFREELGMPFVQKEFVQLPPIVQKGGKIVIAFAAEQDINCSGFQSNVVSIEYPYKSGKYITFDEVDDARWFDLETAEQMINSAQIPLILYLKNQ